MSALHISPRAFLLLCRVTLAIVVLNIVSGAAVRLSDSGLGCPDWPTCTQHHLTPPLRFHALIEFGNRAVVTVLVVACAATLVAALARRPRRRDLRWLSCGLMLGVLGEALVGYVVVKSKLNAYVVVGHFLVGMALLAVATILALWARHGPGRGTPAVARAVLWATRVYLVVLGVAVVAGAMTTGAGPHAGGKGAKRIPIALEDMTRIHAECVLAAVFVLLVVMWLVWRTDAPARVQNASLVLLAVMVAQGIVGYTQYFTHLPAVLVGVHVFGASMVWATALWFHHLLSDHAVEQEMAAPLPRRETPRSEGSERITVDSAPAGASVGSASVERAGTVREPA